VHRGAAAYVDGTERTFLERYSDYFWFSILLLSAFGSAGAWLRQFLKRDEREETSELRNRIMAMISKIHAAQSVEELLAMERDVDAIVRESLECPDDGAIDEEDLAAFGLVLEMFDHPVADRRATLVDQALCMTIWAHAQLHDVPPEWSKQFKQLGLPPL
jgi:hypothetical protein